MTLFPRATALTLATALTAAAVQALAHEAPTEPLPPLSQSVQQVRQATRAFKDVQAAVQAGYGPFLSCVSEGAAGAMGVHYLNNTLVSDADVDPLKPEALTYEPQADGSLQLVGAEYIVFQASWDAAHEQPPSLFGHPFHLVRSPNRYGVDAFYELHFWVWRANPFGLFADWNPAVKCPA